MRVVGHLPSGDHDQSSVVDLNFAQARIEPCWDRQGSAKVCRRANQFGLSTATYRRKFKNLKSLRNFSTRRPLNAVWGLTVFELSTFAVHFFLKNILQSLNPQFKFCPSEARRRPPQ